MAHLRRAQADVDRRRGLHPKRLAADAHARVKALYGVPRRLAGGQGAGVEWCMYVCVCLWTVAPSWGAAARLRPNSSESELSVMTS